MENMIRFIFLIVLLGMMGMVGHATETTVVVRVKAKDAKFIGSSLGGAYVVMKDELKGEVLAEGKTEGSTGNTDLIMRTPRERRMAIADDNTAKFIATIDIDEPIFVTIEVYSPVNNKQAQVHASTALWLIPGKDIVGDGIVVEIPGFIVDVLAPRTHQYMSLASLADKPLELRANVVMMCGCTINKGGLWDADKMEVVAIVKRNGEQLTEVPLACVDTNLFEGKLVIGEAGQYEVIIYAYDEETGNTGVDKVNYVVYE